MSAAADIKAVSTGHAPNGVSPVLTEVVQLSDSTALTPLQQACIMRSLLSPAGGHYIQQMVCEWAEPLQISAWKQAWDFVAGRHDALRASFRCHLNDGLTQHFADAVTVSLNVMSGPSPEVSRDQIVSDFLTTDRVRGFNLDSAPLWRLTVFPWANGEATTVWSFHHSLLDGRSRTLVWQEVNAVYRALLAGTAPVLPPARSFREFTAWLQTAPVEKAAAYWRERLQGIQTAAVLPSLSLVQDYANGDAQPAMETLTLTPAATICLRKAAQRHGVTLNNLVQGVWALVLSQSQAVEEIIFGAVRSGRHWTDEDPDGRVGMFINTIPFRVNTSPSQPVGVWLQGLRAQQLAARAGEHASVEQIRHWCGLSGSTVLFRSLLVFENRDPCELLTNVRQRVRFFEKADLPTLAANAGTTLVLNLKYSPRWHSPVQARAVLEQIRAILETLASASGNQPLRQLSIRLPTECRQFFDEWQGRSTLRQEMLFQPALEVQGNPAQSVQEKPLLTEAERHQILVEWNRTERDYPRDKCIHQLFEEQVERTPDAVAVVFEEDSLTYRELNIRANQLANHLRVLGVGPSTLAGLRVERSIEMIIALLGILKAGGAYWALEENLPEDRIRLMLAEAQPRVLIVRRKSVKHLSTLVGKDTPAGAVRIAAIEDLLESSPKELIASAPPNQAGDPAYVCYTSGSTGRPKGVVVPHRGVVRLVRGADYVSFSADETLLHLSPLSFDASTFEIWGALLNGGRVVLMPPGPPALAEIGGAIRRHGVTTLWLTAGLFHLMVDERLDDLKPLRQLLAGGDALSPERVRKAFRALPDCRIINGYGPTENTTFTCCHTVEDEQALTPRVPIGRPIANTQVYVLDSHQQPVPVGVTGELYAGGDGVACGYLHQPQLTAERFVPDPFSGKPDARLYRTGDLVRWRSDGNLEFLGRIDSQVKIRGFRIELGEVETVLRAQPEVREAVVIAREDSPGDKRLVAYLAANTGDKPDVLTMRTRLAEKLPDYMIPSRFVAVPALPLNPNGKVDRKALLAMETSSSGDAPSAASQPINLLELELIRIWRRLFQRENIDRRDNFFALGGHSLLAVRLAAEMDKRFKCKIPIATLFQSPTIELLARRLTDENWAPAWTSLVPLQSQGSKPPLFLVHGWGGDVFVFLDLARLLPPDQPIYGIQAVGLDGKSPRHISIEEMAAHYVKEIVSFQPDGPIYLAGFSMGGVIAYEMARQLHRLGRRVAMLALLDSEPTGKTPWVFYGMAMAVYIPKRCWWHFRRWWRLPFRERFNYIRGRWTALRYWMVRNRSRPPLITAAPQQTSERLEASLGTDYYRAVAHAYQLRPYPGAVDIFVSDESNPAWRLYWRHLVRGGVSFHRVSGGHLQIVLSPDYMPEMAKSLTTVLLRAQEKEARVVSSRDEHSHANLVS